MRPPTMGAGETICVSVRSADGVGNEAPWSAPRCTSRPFDDRAVATTTGAANQTLRRLNAHVTRAGVLATVCPSCGIVELRVGGTMIGHALTAVTTCAA